MPRQHMTFRQRDEALEANLGKTFCSGWGPSSPDTRLAQEAAVSQANTARRTADLAEEAQSYYLQNFAPVILDQMQQGIDIGRDTYELAREQQRFQLGLARRYDDRFWSVQAPLEDSIVQDAREFDTGAERERLAGEARADVEQAYGGAAQSLRRDMGRMGLNPADPKYFAMRQGLDADKALATATALNKMRQAAKQMGWARKLDAAALGRGLPGFSSGATQMAMGWGGQGMQAGGMGMQGALGAAGAHNAAAGTAGNLFGTAGNLYGGASVNMRANAIESARTPGFDALMGLAAGGLRVAGSVYGGKG